jgi:hypothetical protein
MLYHIIRGYFVVSAMKVSGTEVDTPTDGGRYQNSQYDCRESTFWILLICSI